MLKWRSSVLTLAALVAAGCARSESAGAQAGQAGRGTDGNAQDSGSTESGILEAGGEDVGSPDASAGPEAGPDSFDGGHTESIFNIVLGRPTDTSIAASVLASAGDEVYIEYGTSPGVYTGKTLSSSSAAGEPIVTEIAGLQPDTRYYYVLHDKKSGEADFTADAEHSFHTSRGAGSSFTFGVQGDSHPERPTKMFNADLYKLNMRNVASTRPDFYFAMGDDFSIERLLEKNTLTQENVDAIYETHRDYFGLMADSTALFLVNGNHEQAAGYLLLDAWPSAFKQAPVFAGLSRVTHYALPASDHFYSADAEEAPGVGLLRDYYAWTWGDALFVTIDPYWHSPSPVDNGVPDVTPPSDGWANTMGDAQYFWLKKTLEGSHAKYKFVFEHHVLGTGRGGAAIVHTYEWGGYDQGATTYLFPSKRPTWPKPVHQLFADNKVTIFFFGHDHLFAREMVDGVVYQSVQNPADNTYTAFNADAYAPNAIQLPGAAYDPGYSVVLPNAGFLHVTVAPENVTVSYVRAVLPGDEALAGCANGEVAITYSVTAN